MQYPSLEGSGVWGTKEILRAGEGDMVEGIISRARVERGLKVLCDGSWYSEELWNDFRSQLNEVMGSFNRGGCSQTLPTISEDWISLNLTLSSNSWHAKDNYVSKL